MSNDDRYERQNDNRPTRRPDVIIWDDLPSGARAMGLAGTVLLPQDPVKRNAAGDWIDANPGEAEGVCQTYSAKGATCIILKK